MIQLVSRRPLEQGAPRRGDARVRDFRRADGGAGTTHRTSTEELVHLIKALGKTPVQRDTLYRDVKVWN